MRRACDGHSCSMWRVATCFGNCSSNQAMKSILIKAAIFVLFGAGSAAQAAERIVIVEVETLSQPSWQQTMLVRPGERAPGGFDTYAPTAFPLWYAFHDGSLDTFDVGKPASPELADFAKESLIDRLQARYQNSPRAFTWWVPNPAAPLRPVSRASRSSS